MTPPTPELSFRLTFVVLNYNNPVHTVACLDNLKKCLAQYSDMSLVVVDNDSSDDSRVQLARWCEAATEEQLPVRLIQAGRNGGYGAGNNLGMAAAKKVFDPEWYWILNNDAYLAHDAAPRVLAHLTTTQADLVGMRIHTIGDEPDNDILGGGRLKRWQGRTVMNRPRSRATGTGFLSGSSFLIRATLAEDVGGLVEDHFLFWEEIDLARRAGRFDARIEVVSDAVVNHVGGARSGARSRGKSAMAYYYSTRSSVLYYRRHEGGVALVWLVVMRVGLAFRCLLTGETAGARAVLRGLADGGAMPLRATT